MASLSADVAIVGGGLMGCYSAYSLRRRGRSVVVIDKDTACAAASGVNFGNLRLQGRAPQYTQYTNGSQSFDVDYNNFAPSLGFAWTPNFKGGVLSKIFGDDDTVVDLVNSEYTARATGRKVVEVDEVHIWHFNAAGRVQRFRHRADTLLQAWSIGKA